jgi:hypothetical protein
MSNIKKVAKDKLAKLKYLSEWLKNPSLNPESLIENIDEFNNNTKYKLFSYFLDNPKNSYYLNKYLNNMYDFLSTKYTPLEWLITFSKIIHLTGNKSLWLNRFQNVKRNQFTKLLKEYCKTINDTEFNQAEVNNLFLLFEYNIFSENFIKSLQETVDGKEQKPTKKTTTTTSLITSNTPTDSKTSATVIEYCSTVMSNINNRNQCKYCPGYKREVLVLESEQYAKLDILVLGLYPNINDIRDHKFLSNQSAFKSNLSLIFDKFKLTHGYSNRILCLPNNVEDDNIKKMYNSCSGFSTLVHDISEAKIRIILGIRYAKLLGIKSPTKNMGTLVGKNIFLLPDPNDINWSKNKDLEKLETYFSNLESLLQNESIKWLGEKQTNTTENIDKQVDTLLVNNLINEKNPTSYTLFDIQIVKGNVIYIVIDSNNNKQYITNSITYPIYIKKGKFSECEFIESNMDFIANLSINEKHILSQKLNDNLKRQILKMNQNKPEQEEEEINESFVDDEEMF